MNAISSKQMLTISSANWCKCILIILLIIPRQSAIAQSLSPSSLKIGLQKVYGVGPSGNLSSLITPVEKMSPVFQDIYPKAINKPLELQNVMEYYYVYNPTQLLYQSFCSGILSKERFLMEANKIKLNLTDTSSLSSKALRVGIHIIKGTNAKNQLVYYVDSNNDNDFGDEIPYPLSQQVSGNVVSASVKVPIDFFADQKAVSEEIAFLFTSGPASKDYLGITVGEFKYAKLAINSKPYMLCVEYTSANPSRAYILPDVQYFSGVGNVGKVEINQQVSIENTNIVLSSISPTANAVLFTGDGVKAIKIENRQQSIKSNLESSKVEDRAVGFIAPNIVGKDLHPNMNTLINLHHMKGKYIFIDIWSTFCPPCIADFPNLKKVYDNFKRDKFDIIGIVDERVKNLSQKILDERGIYWPNLLTSGKENQLTGYLHIYEYPTTYLVDPTGRIIASGLDAQGLMSKLSVLLNKK